MTQEQYLKAFTEECSLQVRLTSAKNTDYASKIDAFTNFKLIEDMSNGFISTEAGIITRMSDKFQRLVNLLTSISSPSVVDESIIDTLRDLSVYSKILLIYLEQKNKTNATLKRT